MTARDELATILHRACGCQDWRPGDPDDDQYDLMAATVLAAGWRKMPSAEQIEAHLEAEEFHWSQPWKGDVLDAILALMGGDNE